MAVQAPNIPALSHKADPELRRWCDAVRQWLVTIEKNGGVVAPATLNIDSSNQSYALHSLIKNGNPHGTDHSMLDSVTQSDDTNSNTSGGKHVTNTQVKKYEDHRTDVLLDEHKQYLLLAGRTGQTVTTPLILGTATDNTTIEVDGTIKLNGAATVWDDIDFPIIIRTSGANIPTIGAMVGNITAPVWQVNDFNVCEIKEFPHSWKEASPVQWHIHIITGTLIATDSYLKFEIEYTWANRSAVFPATTIISTEFLILANTPPLTHMIQNIGAAWTPTSGTIAAHIKARLRRITSAGAAGSNPWCEMVQLHYEKDTAGSRLITTK